MSRRTFLLASLLLLFGGGGPFACRAQLVGEYPPISSVATYRPVTATSTCGEGVAENYCRYTANSVASLAPNCIADVCNNTCPHSSSSPDPIAIATLGSLGSGVSATQGRPGSSTSALQFQESSINVSVARVPLIGDQGFSFSAWINQNVGNVGTLISKSSSDGTIRNYAITITQSSITLDYLPSTMSSGFSSVSLTGLSLEAGRWHHIVVTAVSTRSSFYVNGSFVGGQTLLGSIVDSPNRDILLGQLFDGENSFSGQMQEVYFYSQALTVREVTEVYTGSFPSIHLSSECHCPPSHPLIDSNNPATCIQHPPSQSRMDRINTRAHPPSFANDFGTTLGWISAAGDRNVNITFHLTNSLYEIIFVNVRYGSPRPKAAVMELSRDGGVTFEPIQYFADNCMFYFSLQNDGQIVNADDANCVTSSSVQLPTFNGDVRTRLLDQSARRFDLNTSPELRRFILGSHLRLRLVDFFTSNTTTLHQYFSILEVTVAARCACNGHARRCGTDINSVCECLHNTEGTNCERCLPFYNDKAWRYGATNNAYPCKPCNCNNHSTSCHYDATVDPFPDSYEVGGGGVCDNCQDDTAGRFCEICRSGFFRPIDRQPTDPSPCVACNCNSAGITDNGNCAQNEGAGGEIVGQCFCKSNVIGLKCDTCRPSFYGLSSENPDGCSPCNCNTDGTFDGVNACDMDDGQCLCKENVMGTRCDQCKNGTTGLSASNPLGCSICQCNLIGSISLDCDVITGVCSCKPGVGGPLCDQCLPGFYGFSESGCQPCSCHTVGSLSPICDNTTGECTCQENVQGMNCDSCMDGFYDISSGCLACECNPSGSVNGSNLCHSTSGQCSCKTNVEGRTCDTCSSGFTNLLDSNSDGCSACDCFMPNTDTSGNICHPVSSQCNCLSSAMGRRCDVCRDGFYLTESGCVACNCEPTASTSSVCHRQTGQCNCSSAGVSGRRCDSCLSGFYQFPSCESCGCDIAGSVEGSVCDITTGVCRCKRYVTGTLCDRCANGFQMLELSNPLGCSAGPDEQAPPNLLPLSATSIQLTWFEPEAPNGVILGYIIYRNGTQIANLSSSLSYNDTGLSPDTVYSYLIESYNIIGSTRSLSRSVRTLEGAPTGVQSSTLTALNATAVSASWAEPDTTNGVISRYELLRVEMGGEGVIFIQEVVFSGLALSTVVSGLQPFTIYFFVVRACTSGGCGLSEPSFVQTLEAPPTFQPAPNVTSLSSASLLITWDIPIQPNGIITQYEIVQRNAPFTGDGFTIGTVQSGVLSFTVDNLRPFTEYEFHVISSTEGGGTRSDWSRGTTDEDIPEGVLVPVLMALSSTEIQISWSEPQFPNGVIQRYGLYGVSNNMEMMLIASFNGVASYIVDGLQPFTEYSFLIEACTSVGCNRSEVTSTLTLESAPIGQPTPTVNATTNSSIILQWEEPRDSNGIISSYSVHRRSPSLYPSPLIRDIGTSFPGTGFATFPAGIGNLGGLRNTIRMQFRTFSSAGILLYYINAAGTDLLALELRDGIPWFLFDAGSGPGVAQPVVGDGVRFNDGEWHTIVASQDGTSGTVTIDNVYTGSGQSMGSSQVISSNQVLYIGGLPPDDSVVPRTTVSGMGNSNATVSGRMFAGCLFGISLNDQILDFSLGQAVSFDFPQGVGFEQGCPVRLERGNSYIGGGYASLAANTLTSSAFSFTFDFRTTHNEGLLLFAYSSDETAFAVEIRDSLLHLLVSDINGTSDLIVSNTVVCDNVWHRLLIDQSRDELFLAVDGDGDSLFISNRDTIFSSSIFIGGVPMETMAYNLARSIGVNVYAHFSGCTFENIFPSLFVDGSPVIPGIGRFSQLRVDGCAPAAQLTGQVMCSAPWTSLNTGAVTEYTDVNLTPFSAYLYRVGAMNSAGSAFSGWTVAMTEESVPTEVGQVNLVASTSSTLTLSWDTPTSPNGLITRYDITAMPTSTVGLDSPTGAVASTTLNVVQPEMVLLSTLRGLEPATTYSVVLTAYTSGGGGSGTAVLLQTEESVPIGVQSPIVSSVESRRLEVYWDPPLQPNGVIVLYNLFVEEELRFSGSQNSTFIDNLEPFREYSFFVQACTSVGCGNSSVSTGQTLPDSPMGLAAPNLTVLSPSSIQANWEQPDMPNGIILRFELRRLFGAELSQFVIEFSGLGMEMTVSGLTPNTVYSFQLFVFNAGGSTSSLVVEALTLEDIPDGIIAPNTGAINDTAVLVSWSPPTQPNGDITEYMLYQNGTLVFAGLQLSYIATGLQPFTFYSYSISACTVRGCGSSNQSTVQTQEGVPVGYVAPTVSAVTPYAISLQLIDVQMPNGIVEYALYYMESRSGSEMPSESDDLILAFNGSRVRTVEVSGLMPYTNYSFFLEISNSAGTLMGPLFTVQTNPTTPEGLPAPALSLVNATTVLVEWSPPARPNGMILSYRISVFDGTTTSTLDQGLSISALVYNLSPFTLYQVSVTVFNTEGSVDSLVTNITTGETAPSGFDTIVVLERGNRYITISWDPPAAANGILVNYTVLLGDNVIVATPPNVLQYSVSPLLPFSTYTFSVMACTSVGCIESQDIQATTLEDLPEDIPAPFLTSSTGQRVLITWQPPFTPNGIILEYRVERSLAEEDNFTAIGSVDGAAVALALVDIDTEPFTTYEYRIVAENSAGVGTGPVANFTTPEAAPEGVFAPRLTSISSRSIEVQFMDPVVPNGIITTYTISRLSPTTASTSFTPDTLPLGDSNNYYTYVDQNLNPFTTYSYSVMVCTNGGCTESQVAMTTTLEDTPTGIPVPVATSLSFREIEVRWSAPQMPNGLVQNYRLLRKFLGFELIEDAVNCCENYLQTASPEGSALAETVSPLVDVCQLVTTTSAQVTSYVDNELNPYTFYQYCVVVTNNADSAFSTQTLPTQTQVAPMPLVGPQLNATTVNSTAIELVWGTLDVSQLLGPLVGYTLYVKVSGEEGPGDVIFTGLSQSYIAADLLASTEYEFVVSVSNGVGVMFGETASAITDEGIPEDLQAPVVNALSGSTISVNFSEPLQPNGVIISYTIFLDGVETFNQSEPGMIVLAGLSPYTVYTVQVEACTQFGCTLSPLVAIRTLEAVPEGFASPFVTITGPYSANISWSAPTQPNGVITEYQLLQYEVGSGDSVPVVVFSGISFMLSVSNLRPFTMYNYQVVAFNGAGNVSSVLTMATTEEAPPTFIDLPIVEVLSSSEIIVSWSEPDELNGMLQGYTLYRNGSQISSAIFDTFFSDSNLEPFTTYSYLIEVCTNGGCTSSDLVSNTTLEALPEGFFNLEVIDLQARSISFLWQEPDFPNGIITEYVLTLLNSNNNNAVIFRGLDLSFTFTAVVPYTNYSFRVEVCNSVGCVAANQTDVQTLETAPEGFDAPRVRNLTSTSVAIEWRAPEMPNGQITTYILRRGNESFPNDPVVIFEGLAFSYNDEDLLADMSYFYTVEAVNRGGSTISSATTFRTVPDLAEGIDPPTFEVRGPTEIHIVWSSPDLPNGVISSYILYLNGIAVFSDIGFEFTASSLTPFTVYSFYVEVCNQAGCASSITVTATTDQAPPQGVSPPVLAVLGSTAIQVLWSAPTFPNGVISRYEIRRRLLSNVLSELPQYVGGPSVLSFLNSGLDPFTSYEYRLRVTNAAGSTFSDWVSATTLQAIATGIGVPRFADADIFARNVTATWDPPAQPNGIIQLYRLEYRLLLDPTTNLPGTPIVAARVSSDVTTASVSGLSPVTTYEFRIVVVNGAGEGFGEFETVTTDEDLPEGVQVITVQDRTGSSLILSWNPPTTPNGVIREYILTVDGTQVYRNSPSMYTVLGLQPFTSYTLQLAACTSAGCTLGNLQTAMTAEVAPAGQAPPTLTSLSPRRIDISWDPPSQPNGIILSYEVLRQDNGLPSTLTTVYRMNATRNLNFVDNTVLPATEYRYLVRTINSAGQTDSAFGVIVTSEAPPEGLSIPTLTVLSSTSIQVAWESPLQPNGVITMYRAFRTGGGDNNVTVYSNVNREFTDSGLTPFTMYTYVVQACTSGGCSLSPSVLAQTSEAQPVGLAPPMVRSLSESSILVTWTPPSTPNGNIRQYNLTVLPSNIVIVVTNNILFRTVANLQPFTSYTVVLLACNSAGCVQNIGSNTTLETAPQFIRAPILTAVNATAVSVSWTQPSRPNGIIVNYQLRRNSSLVFSGLSTTFTDTSLVPLQYYSYTVQAYTSVGGGEESDASTVVTLSDTPEDVFPPQLEPVSSISIRATWSAPGSPNGVIRRYVLFLNGAVIFNGLDFSYVSQGLQPFISYRFFLMVCTTTCANSSEVSAQTLEAPPEGQSSPQLSSNADISVSISWSPPSTPNGIITSYAVERRQVFVDGSTSSFTTIFNGSVMAYLDSDTSLRPATSYEYRVSSGNIAGTTTSTVQMVRLPDAAPENIPLPQIDRVTANSLNVIASPPLTPNGVLTEYRLYQNGTLIISRPVPISQDSTITFQVSGLSPYTVYAFHVEVCTVGGCGQSGMTNQITAEDSPIGINAPVGVALSSNSINITWNPPQQLNGVIQSYTLWYRTACPQPEQPFLTDLLPCTLGDRVQISDAIPASQRSYILNGNPNNQTDRLTANTAYEFQVLARNGAGSVTSDYSEPNTNTLAAAPEVIPGRFSVIPDENNAAVSLDWSNSFRLNGILYHFNVARNNITLIQSPVTRYDFTNQPTGIRLVYRITAVTSVGRASIEITTQLGTVVPTDTPTTDDDVTVGVPTVPAGEPFYTQAAFIIGMVILGVVILFIICAIVLCLVRPRGDSKFPTSRPATIDRNSSLAKRYSSMSKRYSRMGSPSGTEYGHSTGKWRPGDQNQGKEVPEGIELNYLTTDPYGRSYSPARKMDERLPDTHITSNGSMHQFEEMDDEFGTFKTTFADIKV